MQSDVSIFDYTSKALSGVTEGTYQTLLATAINVTAQAKNICPVAVDNGGRLRSSIMWKTSKESGGNTGDDALSSSAGSGAIVGTSVEYGVYQEFGTKRMKAQPFLRPAVDIVVNKASFQDAIKTAMINSVKGLPS